MRNLKYYPLLLALVSACGTSNQNSSTKTITGGHVQGLFTSWITTSTSTKFEESSTWALEGGMTYFPEVDWAPAGDILWTYDSSGIRTTRGELKPQELKKDTGPSGKDLRDWFSYFPSQNPSFPSPIWSMPTGGSTTGFFLIDNINNLEESDNLIDEIFFKTYVRMKGQNATGNLNTKIIAICSGEEEVMHEGTSVVMPKPLFTETVSESTLAPEALQANEWKYFRAVVNIRDGAYQPMADRCRSQQGRLIAYLDIQVKGTAATQAEFLTTEMITIGGDE